MCWHTSGRMQPQMYCIRNGLPFVATENHRRVEHGHALMDLDDVSNSIRWERTPSLPWLQAKSMVLYGMAVKKAITTTLVDG